MFAGSFFMACMNIFVKVTKLSTNLNVFQVTLWRGYY